METFDKKIYNNKTYYLEVKKSFKDLSEIINFLLKLRLHKGKEGKDNVFWSFRGQRNEAWSLGIADHKAQFLTDKRRTAGKDIKEVDDYDQCLSQYKKRMLHSRSYDYLHIANPWWWLFFAEHHGLHTRLLDWSSNPLVAVYFAVENILFRRNIEVKNKNADIDKEVGGIIWALKVNKEHFRTAEDLVNIYKLDPSSGRIMNENEWFMINPEPVTERIVLQSGKFSFHPGIKPTPIDEMDRREGEELIKLRIHPDYNADIRRELGIMNIHHGSLFPSPTGIANFVNAEWPDIAKY